MSGNALEWIQQQENAAAPVIEAVLKALPQHRAGVLFDVGACAGVVTRAALDAGHWVYAFEPVAEYRELCYRRNPTAKVFPFALGAELGRATIWCDKMGNHGWNTMVSEKITDGMRTESVEVRPLDSMEVNAIDVLKIDVEGYESFVIEGAVNTILRLRPTIIMELGWGTSHPDWPSQVKMMEWLFDIGYQRVPYEFEGTKDVVLIHA